MIVKNLKSLATTKRRKQVLQIIESGIESVLADRLVKKSLKFDPKKKLTSVFGNAFPYEGRILIIGGGKAAGLMAETLESIIHPKYIQGGIVNCNTINYHTQKITLNKAQHPLPNLSGVKGVLKMLTLKKNYHINKKDLIICLLSGGGSSLMPCPVQGIKLSEKQKLTDLLIKSGATIQEINCVRKHLSRVKGGQLGRHFAPATIVSLIISDVIGNNLETIASGPTTADFSTFNDAHQVLRKYRLLGAVPQSVTKHLQKGFLGKVKETPKKLNNCYNFIIGDNKVALEAMQKTAKRLGFKPKIITYKQTGDLEKAAQQQAKDIIQGKFANYDLLLIGGETNPRLPKHPGKGGRNQDYAAASLMSMKSFPGKWVLASIASDGRDYLTGVAGAIIDQGTLSKIKTAFINPQGYIRDYNSYNLFKRFPNILIRTGSIGTNVCDLTVYALN